MKYKLILSIEINLPLITDTLQRKRVSLSMKSDSNNSIVSTLLPSTFNEPNCLAKAKIHQLVIKQYKDILIC